MSDLTREELHSIRGALDVGAEGARHHRTVTKLAAQLGQIGKDGDA